MTRQVRSWAIAALAVFALAGAAAPSFAGITYNVTNYAAGQNGWSVNGTITVSGAGTITNASAITAWDFTASKVGSASQRYSNTTTTASPQVFFAGTLNATSTSLGLPSGSALGLKENKNNTAVNWYNDWNMGMGTISAYNATSENTVLWDTGFGSPKFSPIVGGVWTLGTATPSAVPEIDPAMGGSALSLVAGVLAMIEQRRRRATLVA
jgi:hypothetical protein